MRNVLGRTWTALLTILALGLGSLLLAPQAGAADLRYWTNERACPMPHSRDPLIATRLVRLGGASGRTWVDAVSLRYTGTGGSKPSMRKLYGEVWDTTTGTYRGHVEVYPPAYGKTEDTWSTGRAFQLSGSPRGHHVEIRWWVYKRSRIYPNDSCRVLNDDNVR